MILRKERCVRCGNKINRKFSYCPFCGNCIKSQDRDGFFMPTFKMGFPFNSIFKRLEKQIEKQFREVDNMVDADDEDDEEEPEKAYGFSINIGTNESGQPVIKIGDGKEIGKMIKPKPVKIRQIKISERDAEKFAKLPKAEPLTNVRRLADRIIYEIELPGVKDKNNIIINKLHNSIEIKAFAKDKAFFKLIPVALPLLKYYLEKEKLILELKPDA